MSYFWQASWEVHGMVGIIKPIICTLDDDGEVIHLQDAPVECWRYVHRLPIWFGAFGESVFEWQMNTAIDLTERYCDGQNALIEYAGQRFIVPDDEIEIARQSDGSNVIAVDFNTRTGGDDAA